MKRNFYLTVSRNGSVRATKSQPGLGWDEISIGMTLEIPDKIFQKPILNASITIPEDVAMKSPISAEVRDNVAEAIEQSTGLKFVIKVEARETKK
jgi:hypothetical protein